MFKHGGIRSVTFSDLPVILSWRNHPDIRRFMFTQHEIGMEEHRAWFMRASQDSSRRLLIVEEEGKALGYVQFSQVAEGGVADWGFYVRPDAPKGTGRKLGAMALNHAFGELALHKVCGQAIKSNAASIGFHQSLGFHCEGALREQQCIAGVYHTVLCFGLLASEWRPDILFQEKNDVPD